MPRGLLHSFVEKGKQCNIKPPRTKSYLAALSCILMYVYFDTLLSLERPLRSGSPTPYFENEEMSPERMIFLSGPQALLFGTLVTSLISGEVSPLNPALLHYISIIQFITSSTSHQINMKTRNPTVYHTIWDDIKTKRTAFLLHLTHFYFSLNNVSWEMKKTQ